VIVCQSEIYPRHYRVRYVDFGDTQTIDRSDIFTDVVAYNIPIVVSRYVLDEILPLGSKWNNEFLNSLHALVVDKTCTVTVTEDTPYPGIKGVKLTEFDEELITMDDLSEFLLNAPAISYLEICRRDRKKHKWPVEFHFTKAEDDCTVSTHDRVVEEIRRNFEENLKMEDIAASIRTGKLCLTF
jgi:hypothetical protein